MATSQTQAYTVSADDERSLIEECLDDDALACVFSKLDVYDLGSCTMVSKRWCVSF